MLLLDGLLAYPAGAYEQAIGQWRGLVGRQPMNIAARRLLGAALLRTGDAKGALDTLRPRRAAQRCRQLYPGAVRPRAGADRRARPVGQIPRSRRLARAAGIGALWQRRQPAGAQQRLQ